MEILKAIIELLIHFAAGWQLGKWLGELIVWLFFKIWGDKQMEILVNIFFIGLGLTWLVRVGVVTYVDAKMKLKELDKDGHQKLKY